MNRKLFSVFFSALLYSTLGHEFLKTNEHLIHHHDRSHSIGLHQSRKNTEQCSYLCPVPAPSPETPRPETSLRLVFIEETKVFALRNTTINVTIAFQIGEPITLLANGLTGESFVINVQAQTVVHYPAGSNGNLWIKSKITLQQYLRDLGPLTNVKNWKNGQTFGLNSVTKQLKNVFISIIKPLDGQEIGKRVETNPDAVVSLISILTNDLLDSRDVLQLILVRLQSSVTVIHGGLSEVVNLAVGLKAIGKDLNGGLSSIIKDTTNLSLLMGKDSGITTLIELLLQVSDQTDLAKVLGNLLNPEGLFGLAVQIDRGKFIGLRGLTAVIHNIQLYAAKIISLEAVIDVLIQVEAGNGFVKITKEIWNKVLDTYFVLATSQTSRFNTGSSWSALNKFFQDMKNEKLFISGINVSAIINILIATSGKPALSNVVKILLELKPIVALNKIIATLYFRLIWFIISGHGIFFIQLLIPNIPIAVNLSSTTGILKQILSSVNVFQIISHLVRLDVVGAITHLPAFGPILKAVDDAIKSSGTAVDVTAASSLKAAGSILDELKQLILYGLGRGSKAPSNSGIAGISNLGGGVCISIKTTWVSSEKWSASNGGSAGPSGNVSQSQGGGSGGSGSVGGSQSQGGSGGHSGWFGIGGKEKESSGSGWSLFGG